MHVAANTHTHTHTHTTKSTQSVQSDAVSWSVKGSLVWLPEELPSNWTLCVCVCACVCVCVCACHSKKRKCTGAVKTVQVNSLYPDRSTERERERERKKCEGMTDKSRTVSLKIHPKKEKNQHDRPH